MPKADGRVASLAGECFVRHGERTALVCGRRRLSYAELAAQAADTGAALARTLPDGARVGLYLQNGPEYMAAYFGALWAGMVPFLLDKNFSAGELSAIRADCGLDALLLAAGTEAPSLDAARPFTADLGLIALDGRGGPALRADTEVCRFTSGTTGRPKCLEFSGAAVIAAAQNWAEGTDLRPDDKSLCLATLSNGLAFNTSLLSTFIAGAELHLFAGMPLTRSVLSLIVERQMTRLVAFPTLYRLMTEDGVSPTPLASLRCALSAGAPLWPDVREAFASRFAIDISDYYGIAETGPCTFEPDRTGRGGLGRPLPGVELRLRAGEILVRTASMASGYLNHPGAFEARVDADGFYASGDSGHLIDGRLHLTGRTSDHINVGGRKVDPTEIVQVVTKLPAVRDAVVFADTDAHRETIAHLVVVMAAGDSKALFDACRQELAPYKVPGKISFVDAIPRSGIGKPRIAPLKLELAARSSTISQRGGEHDDVR
jgi:acyl-coenzyme A synthetase/AMP-(fatty) acid ligase